MDNPNINERHKISLINLMTKEGHKIRTWVKESIDKILRIKSKRWIDCVDEKTKNKTIEICELIKNVRPDLSFKVERFLKDLPNKYLIYDEDNKWDRINKLNTNRSDSAVLIADIIEKSKKYDLRKMYVEIDKSNYDLLKDLLNDMSSHPNFIWDRFLINKEKYIANIVKNSKEGEEIENFVMNRFINMDYEIVHKGGDGDLIDMEFGVDLIVKKDNRYNFVQVKKVSSIENVEVENENYTKIKGDVSILNFSLIDTIAYGTLDGNIFIASNIEFYHKKDKGFIKKVGLPIPEKIYKSEIFVKN